jgi:hypothetical protein
VGEKKNIFRNLLIMGFHLFSHLSVDLKEDLTNNPKSFLIKKKQYYKVKKEPKKLCNPSTSGRRVK